MESPDIVALINARVSKKSELDIMDLRTLYEGIGLSSLTAGSSSLPGTGCAVESGLCAGTTAGSRAALPMVTGTVEVGALGVGACADAVTVVVDCARVSATTAASMGAAVGAATG